MPADMAQFERSNGGGRCPNAPSPPRARCWPESAAAGAATRLSPGPAVIASIAYVDPGNFATNIQAGAKYGYGLLWVVLLANLIAMLFQALSAKLGIVTGRNLAEMCRDQFPRPVVLGDVGGQRDRRHGDRSRRVPRRRHRTVAAVSHAALRRHGRDRDRDLRPADVRRLRLPADRTDHRRAW